MPGNTKITPSAPTPKFRSHSCTAFSAVILGSDESLLSIYSKRRVKNRTVINSIKGKRSGMELTKTKSFPRPWYLAKWRKPVCRRLRKEVEGVLTGASVLMEEATRRELGYLKVRRGVGKVNLGEWGERLLREKRVRRVGDVRGTEMVAVMAIFAASNGGGYCSLPLSPSGFDSGAPRSVMSFRLSTVSFRIIVHNLGR